ncbi:hypothetical protein Psuf_064570 [Phytohabitans suffuscus]|uniref:Bacterial transcriptional activator domain-containing protein n=1 Tax=Phytohabitans suffuscus TaxID=624315 RepID=A0A6F8YSQ5_9ACTN|nr:AfsR/SARP family transcriptional regulator [Phytohabitans suffuscus]BCB89144.1 hypothetical protein Psuf_064570 [Phytohabitans suffuscus]
MTTPGGYLFRSTSDDFDLARYERLASEGRQALAAGQNALAAERLTQAQALWRGPALTDVRAGPLLQPQVKRLEESRLTTVEQGIEARLRLGRHQEVLSDLAGMMAEHRLHENLHAQFMVALHRSGRRQEALRVFQQLRTTMTEELGLEPSKRLHLLQQAILSDDPALEVAPAPTGSRSCSTRSPSGEWPRAQQNAVSRPRRLSLEPGKIPSRDCVVAASRMDHRYEQ